MVMPLKAYGELPPMDYIIQKYQDTIETALLSKYMALMSDTQSRSATDAMIKANERANLVAPSGDRISREFLLPMIEAELTIYGDMNVLPQMPAELDGVPFDVVLDNPLLKGQRMDSANSAVTLMQYISQFASIDPSVIDALDPSKLVRYLQETMNVPAHVMRTPEEAEAVAEQKAQAQQIQQIVDAAPKVGSAIKDVATAQAMGQQ